MHVERVGFRLEMPAPLTAADNPGQGYQVDDLRGHLSGASREDCIRR
jgi:hypothetical protein